MGPQRKRKKLIVRSVTKIKRRTKKLGEETTKRKGKEDGDVNIKKLGGKCEK